MVKIMKDCWDANKEKLKEALASRTDLNSCDYKLLVELTFENIFNASRENDRLDLEHMTEIDDGDYQGTLLFMIPFDTYQPSSYEYILTYIGYGSCSGCDALQAAQDWNDEKLTERQLSDFMSICKDLVCNAIKPYNYGWRRQEGWLPTEEI